MKARGLMLSVLELHAFLDEVAWIDVVGFLILPRVYVLCGVDECDISCCVQVDNRGGELCGVRMSRRRNHALLRYARHASRAG